MTISDSSRDQEIPLSDYQQRTARRAIRDVLDGHLSIYTTADGQVVLDRVVMMNEHLLVRYLEQIGVVQRPSSRGRWPVNFAWSDS